jgi:hypothetical protein
MKQLLKLHFIHLIVYSLLIIVAFFVRENGDMNVVILGTALYIPYAFLLTFLNYVILKFGFSKFTDRRVKLFFALVPVLVLVTWFFSVNKSITIRYWTLKEIEFYSLIISMSCLNLATYIFVRLNKVTQPIK